MKAVKSMKSTIPKYLKCNSVKEFFTKKFLPPDKL